MLPHRPKQPFGYEWLLPLMTLGLVLGIVLSLNAASWQPAAMALAASLTAALLLPGKRRIAALMLASAALGALVTFHANHPDLPAEGEYVVTGVVMDEILLEGTDSIHLKTALGDVTLNGEPHDGGAYWSAYTTIDKPFPEWLSPGVRVSFTAEVYHPDDPVNPGGYNSRVSFLADGIDIGIYGIRDPQLCAEPAGLPGQLAALRHSLTMDLRRVMGEEEGGLAAAMLLGPRDYITDEDYAAFKRLGIAHILSVSGYHVGVLAMLLTALLTPLSLPRSLRVLLLSILLALYAMLTGAAPPVIRAGLLLLLREAGKLRHRRNLPLHLLCLSAACQLIFNPMQLFGPSFQLTYSAMLGLVLVHPRLREACHPSRPWMNWFWQGFSASLAVQLGLLPSQMYWFCGFQLASIVLNVFVMALMSFVMALYWLTLALLPIPIVREVFGALTGTLTNWMLAGIRWLASVIGYSLWTPAANLLTVLGWALVMLGLSVLIRSRHGLWRRTLAFAGAFIMALSLFRLPNNGAYWIQFSDGEADAALLHDRHAVILVDAGESVYTAANYLQNRRLSVDALILTHLHADHAGGIEGLLNCGIPVKVCYLPEGAHSAGDIDPIVSNLLIQLEATGTELAYLSRGDVLHTPSGQLTVLWPQAGTVRSGQSANDTCLVMRAEIMGTTMLLTGDMTSRYEMYTAAPADILKAAHHGSAESTSPEFLAAVSPQAILLSCGETTREESLALRTGDIPVYSTHSSGAITIRFAEDAFTIETYLPR